MDIGKITRNARYASALCGRFGIEVVGVTKSACGHPSVARAMLAGGVGMLGDSRLENLARMREAGIGVPMMLLRSPALSESARCVALADVSLNVSVEVLRALDGDAARAGRTHGVILMVDLDTGREGLAPAALPGVCREVAAMRGLDLRGVGVYFARSLPVGETMAKQRELVSLAGKIEADSGIPLPVVSGGSSYAFCAATVAGRHVPGVNQLRLGMVILQGIASSKGPQLVEGFHHDTFVLRAEIIEIKQSGVRLGLLGLGRVDADPAHLFPVSPEVRVVTASADHTMVDLTDVSPAPRVGDRVSFRLGYYAMNRLMLSPYVSLVEA